MVEIEIEAKARPVDRLDQRDRVRALAKGTFGWSTASLRFSRTKVTPSRSPRSAIRRSVSTASIHIGPVTVSAGTTACPFPSRPVP